MKPEFAFYYPGQYWGDPDWVKNLILFFDGIAVLIPDYMRDHGRLDDQPIVESLREHGLFHVIRPEEHVGEDETKKLAESLIEIIASGSLDHLNRDTAFGSLSMSRLGYYGDRDLANFVLEELKERGLARDSEDGVSIPMHATVRGLVLVLLSQVLRHRGESMGVTLSPATDKPRYVEALSETVSGVGASNPSVGDIVSFDMATVGVNLASVPMDEILDFRNQNYSQHRNYVLLLRQFARELSLRPEEERQAVFESRQEELDQAAREIKNANRRAWGKMASFAITLSGAAWNLHEGNVVGAAFAGAGAIASMASSIPASNEQGVYSYLFSARREFM